MPSKSTFHRPADGRIVSLAGPRSYVGRFGNMHYGVDIGAFYGWTVRAAWSGVVTHNYGTGDNKTLVIKHFDGSSTAYLHNSRNLVRVGQRVETGQKIAEVGTAGSGPHLHFEYHPNGWYTPSQAQINATNDLLRGTPSNGSSNPKKSAPKKSSTKPASSKSPSGSKPFKAGFYRATEDASLHTRPDSDSKKVRNVEKGDLLVVSSGAKATQWWVQVGDLWVQRKRIRTGAGSGEDKLFHGNFPDRDLPVNGSGTRELELAWQELFLRIGWWKNKSVKSSMWQYFGHLGYKGNTVERLQTYLRDRGYYKMKVDGVRGSGTIAAEKNFLNYQRGLFTPKPPTAKEQVRGFSGKVY